MQSLKHLIKHAVRRAGITEQVSATQIISAVKSFLDAAVLPGLRSSIHLISYRHGVLKAACEHAVAAHELRSLESGIREVIIKTSPVAELKHLSIHIGTRPSSYEL